MMSIQTKIVEYLEMFETFVSDHGVWVVHRGITLTAQAVGGG